MLGQLAQAVLDVCYSYTHVLLCLVCLSVCHYRMTGQVNTARRSHPEMVGDMSSVTLNFDLSKIPFVHF